MMKQAIGNLPENIEELIHDYIKNSCSIMLAVQAFKSPIVTSDSLKLATLNLLDPSLDTYEI
jgi:hypothetical protein